MTTAHCQILPPADRLLLQAVREDLPKTVAALLSESANPDASTVEAGADIHAKNPHDATALLMAVQKGFVEIVKLLLQRGADPNVADTDGDTPLSLAKQFGHTEIIELLTSLK